MLTLYSHPFSPHCRFVRLVLGEYDIGAREIEERPWERRKNFLMLNPAGDIPVVVENDGPAICGAAIIMEYLDETRGYRFPKKRLLPDSPETRAETRRLVSWFLEKMDRECVGALVREKIYKLDVPPDMGGGPPDSAAMRAARANLKHHLRYIGYLAASRNWLSGSTLTFADLAAAAALSSIDYLGEVPWDEDANAKTWYARIKSRPSFRTLLADVVRGLPPAANYLDLDF
ncbi:MAG: glutathione S-transferase family protein [Pseudomonadota bacterium]